VLIVEDDAQIRKMYRTALLLAGFAVREATDGLDALRALDEGTPDLVILDLGLPLMSGFSIHQELAAQAHTRHIPVVIVTGSDMNLDHLDVPCVLRKPVDPDQLVKTVHSCLGTGSPGAGHT